MTTTTVWMLIAIAIYLVGMLGIGLYYSKNQTNSTEFYLGGRKLGPLVTALSTEASDMSSWLLMGVPGLAFFCGVAEAGWTAAGLALGTYLNWLSVAKRLRLYSAKIDAITVPDFLSRRFRDNTKLIEFIGALMVIVFFVPYTASGFVACGKLFSTLLGSSDYYVPAMLISTFVIVAYTSSGGFMAASVTSLIQSLVMTFALIVVLIFGINAAGGWDNVVANAQSIPGYLDFTASTNITSSEPGQYGALTIASTLAWGLGYFGMPHILLHFMAIEDEEKLKTSRRVGTVWVVISLAVAVVIGIVGYAMAQNGQMTMFGSSSEAETLIVATSLKISGGGILPRFGKTFKLDKAFDNVEYIGRTGETYIDMRDQFPIGRVACKVADMTEPNIKPQESGNRMDVTEASVSDGKTKVSFIAVDKPFELGIKPYTDRALAAMKHREDEKRTGTYVTIQAFQQGIGTGACGPAIAKEHQYSARQDYELKFIIRVDIVS